MTIQNTPNYGFPYPQLADSADVPRDIGALADAVDSKLRVVELAGIDRVPIGAMMMWATANAPVGWAMCDGLAKNRVGNSADGNNYSALFSVIGAAYGAPDGATFNLPNLKSRFPLGAGQDTGLSNRVLATKSAATGAQATLGEETHKALATESGVPIHAHGNSFAVVNQAAFGTDNAGTHAHYLNPRTQQYNSGAGTALNFASGANGFYRTEHTTDAAGDHAHGIPAHGHGMSGGVTNNAAAAAIDPHNNMPPFLVINFIIRYK